MSVKIQADVVNQVPVHWPNLTYTEYCKKKNARVKVDSEDFILMLFLKMESLYFSLL